MTEPLLVTEQLEVVYGEVVRAMQGVSLVGPERGPSSRWSV